jgi:hypothetical protein
MDVEVERVGTKCPDRSFAFVWDIMSHFSIRSFFELLPSI